MGTITEDPVFREFITSFDTTTVLLGGGDGAPMNIPIKELADRTKYLMAMMMTGTVLPVLTDFAEAVLLDGARYYAETDVAGPLTFTTGGSPVPGAYLTVRLIANGTDAPTFSGMSEISISTGYDNTAGAVNLVRIWRDDIDTLYSIAQKIGGSGGGYTFGDSSITFGDSSITFGA